MNKIIFDTDIGGDCDDAGALAILHEAQNAGKAELLAVTLSTSSPYAAGCADAINRYYGHIVPIADTNQIGSHIITQTLERILIHIFREPRDTMCTDTL